MMFMPLISRVRFSQDELLPEDGAVAMAYYNEDDVSKLGYALSRADAVSIDEGLACRGFIEMCPKLRWIQLQSVGCSKADLQAIRERGIILTTARGVCGAPVSEHVFMQLLVMCRQYASCCINQKAGAWVRSYPENFLKIRELSGKTIGILGTGDIGYNIAKRAKAFNMATIGYNRTGIALCGFDSMTGPGTLDVLLENSDFIVLALPLDDSTYHIIGKRELEFMKQEAVLVNVSRGSTIDEKALAAALEDKRIAGAALDVFEEEPLPPESPLWKMDNVVITPHYAGWGENFKKRYMDIVHANYKRFINGNFSEMTGRVC